MNSLVSVAAGTLLLGSLVTGACDDQSLLAEPELGKADVSDSVSMRGLIEFGAAIQDEIREDFEFHGYLFRARAGAEVTLEITHLGSSAGFDTSLLVYEPGQYTSNWAPTALAKDDDSGFGLLSKIEGLVLDEQATYLAVVATPMATGRGRYRLELRCDGSDCAPTTTNEPCPIELEEFIRGCIFDEIADDPQMSEETAFSLCVDSPFSGFGDEPEDVFFDLCDNGFGPAPDWCQRGVDEFVLEMIPSCIDEMTPEFAP